MHRLSRYPNPWLQNHREMHRRLEKVVMKQYATGISDSLPLFFFNCSIALVSVVADEKSVLSIEDYYSDRKFKSRMENYIQNDVILIY